MAANGWQVERARAALDEVPGNLIEQWIEANPRHPGADDVRIRRYGVPVWALIGHARATQRPAAAVAADYELPLEAVEAAFAYYDLNRSVIDARLAANAA
jgi:uncharacterized protein (DUF433 family)